MSRTGIPSVIAITVSTPDSIASSIAGAAKRAGTKIIEVLAPASCDRLLDRVEDRHALDVLAALAGRHPGRRGRSRRRGCAGRGRSPRGRSGRRRPASCSSPTMIDISRSPPPARRRGGRRRASSSPGAGWAGRPRRGSPGPPRSWCRRGGRPAARSRSSWPRGGDDPLGDLVAAGDAAEDVEEDRGDLLVGGDHGQRVDDRLGFGAAAGVEEVGRGAARLGDDVEGRHAEPGAVGEDADVAVELDVGEALLLRHRLLRVLDRRRRSSARSSWRKSALPSIVTLASRATTSRSAVTISGLTSISVASSALATSASFDQHLGGLRRERPRRARRRRRSAAPRRRRTAGSGRCGSLTSASGSSAATASMSIPPLAETIASSFFSPRSRITEA